MPIRFFFVIAKNKGFIFYISRLNLQQIEKLKMEVLQYISELLVRQDCVIVPGLGGFIANYSPAKIHPVLHSFTPPAKDIVFNASLKSNDGLLANYIAIKEKITYADALARIQQFSESCSRQLRENGRVEIIKVGTLFPDREGNIQFEPGKDTNYLLESYGFNEFTSPAIKREGIQQRLQRTFDENKQHRSERTPKGRKALRRLTIISIPAAALFVWGVFNVGLLKDIYTSNSGFFPLLNKESVKTGITHITPAPEPDISTVYAGLFDTDSKTILVKNPSAPDSDVIYPFITGKVVFEAADTLMAVETEPSETAVADVNNAELHYYIIGSCNKTREFAENYLREIKAKGFSEAGITGPSGAGYYKVYFGRYASEQEAMAGLAKAHEANPAAWLMKL